jgi:hypothetical protein
MLLEEFQEGTSPQICREKLRRGGVYGASHILVNARRFGQKWQSVSTEVALRPEVICH